MPGEIENSYEIRHATRYPEAASGELYQFQIIR